MQSDEQQLNEQLHALAMNMPAIDMSNSQDWQDWARECREIEKQLGELGVEL